MKKRKIKRVVAGAMALLMMINALPGTDSWLPLMTSYASTARVNATSLNVRSGPGTTYSIAGKLTNGNTVTVLGQTTGSDGKTWSQIRFAGTGGAETTGYVLSTYLKNPTSYSHDGNFESYLTSQGFPESYKDGLRLLHAEYPNWVFTAQHTNLDWNTVIENESVVGRNLVYTSSISSWKSIADGAYNWDTSTWPGFDSSSYVAASSDIIKYYMDPRNFLDDKYVFQFLTHSYDSSAQTAEGLKSMVQGTFLSGSTTATGTSGSSSGGPGVSGSTGSSSSSASLTGPGVSGNSSSGSSSNSGSSGSSGPGSSTSSGSSNSGVSLTGPGSGSSSSSSTNSNSTGSSSSNTGTSGSTSSSSKANVSFEAPGKTSNSNSNVKLEGPSASISKKEAGRVTTVAPGMSDGPGGSSGSGSSSSDNSNVGPGYSSAVSNTETTTASYVDILMNAASKSGVNPYVLAAMILQEQGTNGTGKCISGTVAGYQGYYNFFNIEAYQSGSMDAISRGLWYASQSGSYERPWNSRDRAIIGGAEYYGTNYVKVGQDTFYLKKFNVQGSNLYKHQYMTNIQAAAAEGAKLAEAYGTSLKQSALEFKIPVYNNMPSAACAKPTTDGSPNNKLSGLGVDGFALTPTFSRDVTSYDLIVNPSVTEVTVNAVPLSSTASISGTGTIQLQSGNNEITISVKAQNGTVREYQIHVVRQDNGPTHNSALGSGISGGSSSGSSSSGSNYGPGYSSASSNNQTSSGGSDSTTGPGVSGNSSSGSAASDPSSTGPGTSTGTSQGGNTSGPGGSNVTIVR